MTSEVDLAIVGAGAAGLAAARTARDLGLTTAVLEAKDRIGGRAHTDVESFGVPFDRGCHTMHSASRNPFVAMAEAYGFAYQRRAPMRRLFLGDRWAGEGERRSWAWFARRRFAAMEAAGAAGRDVAASEVTDRHSRWTPLFDGWLSMLTAADSDEASTADHANYVDTGENWRVREGFGALVARYGADVPVALRTPVARIDWHRTGAGSGGRGTGGRGTGGRGTGGGGIALETAGGSLRARAAIVTVSTNVLAADAIRFDPPLPAWKRAAIEALPTGHANKIALQFDGDPFGVGGRSLGLLSAATPEVIAFQIHPFGRALVTGFVGGRASAELELAGEGAAVDLALAHLRHAFGTDVGRHLRKGVFTAWASDPWIRGAYSAARPGQAHRRADLARPIDDRLFFAGEATSTEFFSTAHGAYFSGCAAAEAAAKAIAGQGRGR